MQEKYNFVGKGLQMKDKEETSQTLENWQKQGSLKFDNELEKTEEEIIKIKKVENAINEELSYLGLNPDFVIQANEVHIIFQKIGNPLILENGVFNSGDGQIKIIRDNNPMRFLLNITYQLTSKAFNKNVEKREKEFRTLIHESTHKASHLKYIVNVKEKKLDSYRTGYRLAGREDSNLFLGLNEAVVEKTTKDILSHIHSLKNENFKKIQDVNFNSRSGYWSQLLTLNKILEKIAQKKNEKKEDVWSRFKKGQFTGEMMHLRDIEKVFGPGSLRVIASMGGIDSDLSKQFLYYSYFSTDSNSVKNLIAKFLLSNVEKKKYDNHINKMKENN